MPSDSTSCNRVVWGDGGLTTNRIKEVARTRNAWVNDCGHCRNIRLDTPRDEGLTEEIGDDITDDHQASGRLDEAEKAVLRPDAMLFHRTVDSATNAELRRYLTDAQIAELWFGVAKLGAVSKLLITLGMEPAQPMAATVAPTGRVGLLSKFRASRAGSGNG